MVEIARNRPWGSTPGRSSANALSSLPKATTNLATLSKAFVGILVGASIYASVFLSAVPESLSIDRELVGGRRRASSADATKDHGAAAPSSADELTTGRRHKKISNIALLLSFPNSGTTYTLANSEYRTNISTATNYESEVLSPVLVPVNHDADAPFLFSPHRQREARFVLTKTHGIGYSYCDDCHHSQTVQDVEGFGEGCRRADLNIRLPALPDDTDHCYQTNRYFWYSTQHILKVVHLLRNPYDNVVARMHLGAQLRREEPERVRISSRHRNLDDSEVETFLRQFNDTNEGVLAWCRYADDLFHDESSMYKEDGSFRGTPSEAHSVRNVSIPESTMSVLRRVPCHSEWFRYVQWHNLAVEMYKSQIRMVDDAHVVYYEDYTNNLDATSREISTFLEQPVLHEPLKFIPGKVYRHLFSEQDRLMIGRLVHQMATPDCWRLLKRYFGDLQLDDNTAGTLPLSSSAAAPTDTYVRDRTEQADEREPANGNETLPKIVWLLSFPQSGSRLTTRNLKLQTRVDVATHYWNDVGPDQSQFLVYPNASLYSPMWIVPLEKYEPTKLVLTRNHCTGTCPFCHPVELYRNMERMCRSVTRSIGGNDTVGEYSRDLVKGAVLLVRNPFDVIRSRATRGVIEQKDALNLTESEAANLKDTRQSLDRWCRIVDDHFEQHDEGPPPPPSSGKPTWNILYRSLIATRRWYKRRLNCPNLIWGVDDRYRRLQLTPVAERVTEENATEYPIDRQLLDVGGYRSVPCYSDWLRYVQFHNYALQEIRDLDGYVLYFEKYVEDERKTLGELARYMKMSNEMPGRLRFKRERAVHKQLYSPAEARQLADLVRTLASDETWGLLRHYFVDEDWYQEEGEGDKNHHPSRGETATTSAS